MKLKFIVDQDHDLRVLHEFIKKDEESLRFFKSSIDINLLRKIRLLDKEDAVSTLKEHVEKRHQKIFPYLEKTAKMYQQSWDEINNEFFSLTEKITGYSLKHTSYLCTVSFLHKGISNWGGNKIIRGWRENPYSMRKITAHELLISHIFTIFEKDFKEEDVSNNQIWKIAEISAFAICGLEEEMVNLWPWITATEKYPLNHNYPHIYDTQRKLRPKYENKESFKSFLRDAIESS